MSFNRVDAIKGKNHCGKLSKVIKSAVTIIFLLFARKKSRGYLLFT